MMTEHHHAFGCRVLSAFKALLFRPEDEPPHFTDGLIEAKLIAQESASQPLGWGRSHDLLRAAIRAGAWEERERIREALDKGGVRDD